MKDNYVSVVNCQDEIHNIHVIYLHNAGIKSNVTKEHGTHLL